MTESPREVFRNVEQKKRFWCVEMEIEFSYLFSYLVV
ncbi:hypothetical protein C5S31_03740 [ANME-1 cluster archaeon GoMg2]|nr:hypothetical protein [ANME-1 cluster archaeon GoMg2]